MCQTPSMGCQFLTHALDSFRSFTHSCHLIVSSLLTATHFYLKLNPDLFPELHIFIFFLDPTWISPRTLKLNRFKGLLPCSLLPCLSFLPWIIPKCHLPMHTHSHIPAHMPIPFPVLSYFSSHHLLPPNITMYFSHFVCCPCPIARS